MEEAKLRVLNYQQVLSRTDVRREEEEFHIKEYDEVELEAREFEEERSEYNLQKEENIVKCATVIKTHH